MPKVPAPELSEAVADALAPLNGPLLPFNQAELASALAYGLRFDERGRPRRRTAWEMAVTLPAEQLRRSSSEPASWSSSARPTHCTPPGLRATVAAFVELAAWSDFSFVDSALNRGELVQTAQAHGLARVGICDLNSLAGVVRGHVVAKAAGLPFRPCRRSPQTPSPAAGKSL